MLIIDSSLTAIIFKVLKVLIGSNRLLTSEMLKLSIFLYNSIAKKLYKNWRQLFCAKPSKLPF